jgi:predicted metalloprotease with PDZ domain
MRAMWQKFGKPGGRAPGYVDRPYTIDDARQVLGAVSGDAAFADRFFATFIQGHDVANYQALLARAGLVLRRAFPGQPFIGQLRIQDAQGRARISTEVPFGSPAYAAGLERDDVIVSVAGKNISNATEVERTIREHKPGESIPVEFERRGQQTTGTLRLIDDPRVEIVTTESTGTAVTAAQKSFRDAWLHLR